MTVSVPERVPPGAELVSVVGSAGVTWGMLVGVWWVWLNAAAGYTLSVALGAATCLFGLPLLLGYAGVFRLHYWGYALTVTTAPLWLLAFAVVPSLVGVDVAVIAALGDPDPAIVVMVYGASLVAAVGQVCALVYLLRRREEFYEDPPSEKLDTEDHGGHRRRRPW